MKYTLFIVGPDDQGLSKITRKNNQLTNIELVGILPIYPEITKADGFKGVSNVLILGVHQTIDIPKNLKLLKVINLVSNPDGSLNSLKAIDKLISDYGFTNVINPPLNIEKTSRLTLFKLLNDIPNVLTSRVVGITPKNINELKNSIEAHKFSYPLIVRLSGYHNAKFMKKINSESELIAIQDWFKVNRDFILLDYFDCLNSDGFYYKARIAVIDGGFYPQHYLSSKNWCIKASCRSSMLDTPKLQEAELSFLERFDSEFLPKHKKALDAIHSKIGLDIYGIDCCFTDNGELIVFEANACMDMLSMWYGPNQEYEYIKPYKEAVKKAMVQLLNL